MVNPKVKGGLYEREIAKRLSLWVTDGECDDLFWRSAMSGGRGTLGVSKNAVGDICAIDPRGAPLCQELFFECKHLKEVSLDQTVRGKGEINAFWIKTVHSAKKHQRFPVLIVKRNNLPDLFITCDVVTKLLALPRPPRAVIYVEGASPMNVFLLKDILNNKCPSRWRKTMEKVHEKKARRP